MPGHGTLSKELLCARFRTLEGAAAMGPIETSSPEYKAMDDSLRLEFVPTDFPADITGQTIILEVSLSLTHFSHEGPANSGTEVEVRIDGQGRLRGKATVSGSGQSIPMTIQGWVSNVLAPVEGRVLSIEPWWHVLGEGKSSLLSRGYGAVFLRASAYKIA